jgi:TatD DNase family protein
MLIDTHAHLNEPVFAGKIDEVICRAKRAAIDACVVPAYDVDSFPRTNALAQDYPRFIFPAYGIHPWFVSEPFDTDQLKQYLKQSNTVAVGEIGLDFGIEYKNEEKQIQVLKKELNLAAEYELPVIFHCRKAFDPLCQILSSYRGKIRGVMHSFSGSKELMERFIDLGLYISFSGSVTRKSARKYHRNAASVPPDRYLIETDAPSIATESTVASEVEPMHVVEIANKIAELRNRDYEDICRESSENAQRLFNIKIRG